MQTLYVMLILAGLASAQPPRFPPPARFPDADGELPPIPFKISAADLEPPPPAGITASASQRRTVIGSPAGSASVPFGERTSAPPAGPASTSSSGSTPTGRIRTVAPAAAWPGVIDCPT